MAVFQINAGSAFRAENLGLDLAGVFASDARFYSQIFTDGLGQTKLYLSSYQPVTYTLLTDNIGILPGIVLYNGNFDDDFSAPNYDNSALFTFTGITADFALHDYGQGAAEFVGTLSGGVYDLSLTYYYSRVRTETQEIARSNVLESFTGLFMGDDQVTLGALADYFCDPQGDLTLRLGGGDDLGIHMNALDLDDVVVMRGEAGNDQLSTLGGQGTLYGGTGRDVITSYSDGAYVINAGTGRDQVYAKVGVIVDMAGDGNDDYSAGGAGSVLLTYDSLTAGIVADLWTGFVRGVESGHDTVSGIRQLRGTQADDRLSGAPIGMMSEFGCTLWGDAGNDTIRGTSQADMLWGGAGRDVLTGGDGADVFAFAARFDTTTADRITDFDQGQDVIDLHLIDAISGGSNDSFAFIGSAAFTAAGQLRAFQTGTTTVIEANTTGTDGAEMRLILTGLFSLVGSDFVL